jgi:hypothetical protein
VLPLKWDIFEADFRHLLAGVAAVFGQRVVVATGRSAAKPMLIMAVMLRIVFSPLSSATNLARCAAIARKHDSAEGIIMGWPI